MKKEKRIYYIHSPSNSLNNGGVETLHQLAHHLKINNFKAYISFYPQININTIPKKLLKYNVDYQNYFDLENSIHIIPEVDTSRIKLIKKGKCIIYWLSVDSYFQKNSDKPFWKNWNYYRKTLNKRIFLFRLKKFQHLVNSHYAKYFLEKRNIKSTILKGYISNYYSDEFNILFKKNIVLYNPQKDKVHIKKIKKLLPDYEFKGLSNMLENEIKENYIKSKIFLDLGTHPGRERMPREASMMGCILILANRGSVQNKFDVPINDLYKINLHEKDYYEKVVNLIKNISNKYEHHLKNFDHYRKLVSYTNEHKIFDEIVKQYFSNIDRVIK